MQVASRHSRGTAARIPGGSSWWWDRERGATRELAHRNSCSGQPAIPITIQMRSNRAKLVRLVCQAYMCTRRDPN